MQVIKRASYWRLTLSYWPQATDAGVEPVEVPFMSKIPESFPYGGYYHSHSIDFDWPPSRQDLAAVIAATPWMSGWEEKILPAIARSDWPIVEIGMKAADTDLLDEEGRIVGRLEVRREERWCNSPYRSVLVSFERLRQAAAAVPEDRRSAAIACLVRRRYRVAEIMVGNAGYSHCRMLTDLRQILIDAGFLKPARRRIGRKADPPTSVAQAMPQSAEAS